MKLAIRINNNIQSIDIDNDAIELLVSVNDELLNINLKAHLLNMAKKRIALEQYAKKHIDNISNNTTISESTER